MTWETTPGFDTRERCPARTRVMCACIRWAMNICSAGGMILSIVPRTYQLWMVFQAGGPEGWLSALNTAGDCVAAASAACLCVSPLAKSAEERSGLDVQLGVALRRTREWHEVEDRGRRGRKSRAGTGGIELQGALALLGSERVDVDERLDVRVAVSGVGDDHAAVGVSDEDDRSRDRLQIVGDRLRVAL